MVPLQTIFEFKNLIFFSLDDIPRIYTHLTLYTVRYLILIYLIVTRYYTNRKIGKNKPIMTSWQWPAMNKYRIYNSISTNNLIAVSEKLFYTDFKNYNCNTHTVESIHFTFFIYQQYQASYFFFTVVAPFEIRILLFAYRIFYHKFTSNRRI